MHEVHSSRLWFYSTDDNFTLTQEIKDHFQDVVKEFDVKKVLDHRLKENHLEYLIGGMVLERVKQPGNNIRILLIK